MRTSTAKWPTTSTTTATRLIRPEGWRCDEPTGVDGAAFVAALEVAMLPSGRELGDDETTAVAARALRGGAPPDLGLLGSARTMVLHPCSRPSQRPRLPAKAEVGKPESDRGMAPVHCHKRGMGENWRKIVWSRRWGRLRRQPDKVHFAMSCGALGVGKTQLGIQLVVSVQIPVDCGGLGGKAVYIDTEGSFMVECAHQIAEACIRDTLDKFIQRMDLQSCQEKMQPNNFLSNIFYFRICSYTEQVAEINYLEKFLEEQKNVNYG